MVDEVREPTAGVSALGVDRGSVLLEVGFVEPTDRRDRGVPRFVVPRHRGDVVGVHQPGPVRDERRDVVVAPLSEGVVVRATVRVVPNPPLVHRGVGVCRVESVQYHFILTRGLEFLLREEEEERHDGDAADDHWCGSH